MKYYLEEGTILTKELVTKFIDLDAQENARKIKLFEYYKGNHKIKQRTYEDLNKPNNKVVNPYPRYITTLMTGYFMGEPVQYTAEDDEKLLKFKEIMEYNDEPSVNKELAKNASVCGVAYEIEYIDNEGNYRFKALPSIGMLLIYDNTLEEKLLYAIRYWNTYDITQNKDVQYVEVYSPVDITKYTGNGVGTLTQISQNYHMFGQVPVNVYYNNEEEQGDFELVISEIDAYDSFESDSVNEADYFADSYLALVGMEGTTSEDIASMKELRVLKFPEGGSASWLTKTVNDSWIENEKKRLDQDIHKFSFCPPMTDEDFAGNASGVAMKYKLLGLETAVGVKETEFEKGLRRRIEMVTGYNKKVSDAEYLDINIVFTRNLPGDLDAMVDTVAKLQGVVSDETRLAMLPMDIDVNAEIEKVSEQKLSNFSLFGAQFNEEDNGEEKETDKREE
jgi:SPP1 family phage portal protein